MPGLKITRLDILSSQATRELKKIADFDIHDPRNKFRDDRASHVALLEKIYAEVETLGMNRKEFYHGLACETEIYETDRRHRRR